MENRVSFELPEDRINRIREAFAVIRSEFGPFAESLTPKDRQGLAKMADGTEAFVMKVMEYAVSNPQFNPPFMDVAELKKDLEAYFQLKPLNTMAKQLADEFSDTMMLAGSEAYTMALTYYHSAKMAARMNVPGAKAVFEDLRKRFEVDRKRKSEETE